MSIILGVGFLTFGLIVLGVIANRLNDRREREAFEATLTPEECLGFEGWRLVASWHDYMRLVESDRARALQHMAITEKVAANILDECSEYARQAARKRVANPLHSQTHDDHARSLMTELGRSR